MAKQLFRASVSTSLIAYPGQAFSRTIDSAGASGGANGSSVVLAAGASASGYATSAALGITGSLIGDWKIGVIFQATIATTIFTKVRVHRVSVSGTTPTILASSTYTPEINNRRTNTTYTYELNQVNLGTWSSTDRFAIEYVYRNAGSASSTPQPAFGPWYFSFIYSPIDSSTIGYSKGNGNAGQREYAYSRGGIKGTIRLGNIVSAQTISSGIVIGVSNQTNKAGQVIGQSISSGAVFGKANLAGQAVGQSVSSGIASGSIGFIGQAVGQSISSGIAYGLPNIAGQAVGQSVSSGAASGSQTSGGSFEFPAYKAPTKPHEHMAGRANGYIFPIGILFGRANLNGRITNSLNADGKANGFRQHGIIIARPITANSLTIKGKKHYPHEQMQMDEMFLAGII